MWIRFQFLFWEESVPNIHGIPVVSLLLLFLQIFALGQHVLKEAIAPVINFFPTNIQHKPFRKISYSFNIKLPLRNPHLPDLTRKMQFLSKNKSLFILKHKRHITKWNFVDNAYRCQIPSGYIYPFCHKHLLKNTRFPVHRPILFAVVAPTKKLHWHKNVQKKNLQNASTSTPGQPAPYTVATTRCFLRCCIFPLPPPQCNRLLDPYTSFICFYIFIFHKQISDLIAGVPVVSGALWGWMSGEKEWHRDRSPISATVAAWHGLMEPACPGMVDSRYATLPSVPSVALWCITNLCFMIFLCRHCFRRLPLISR